MTRVTEEDRADVVGRLRHLATTRPLVTLSLGAGVQSTTLALLSADGDRLPPVDVAVFADTGWEPAAVYEHLHRLEDAVPFPVLRVSKGNLRRDLVNPAGRFATIPWFTQREPGPCSVCQATGKVPHPDAVGAAPVNCGRCKGSGHDDGKGIGRRQCTSEYKLTPIRRALRELLGAASPDYKRVPKGRTAEQWIGFSTDEIGRANRQKDADGVSYLLPRYPLLDLDMSRTDCQRWLRARGWGSTAKSACIGCPYHGNRAWRDLRDNHPAEWADALELDAAIRKGGARGEPLIGEAFLHRSLLPLSIAPIDRITSGEWAERQGDLLEAVADQLAEDGDMDGCSPFGCRSGEAVA